MSKKEFSHSDEANAIGLLEEIIAKHGSVGNATTAQVLQTAVNLLMQAERRLHLQENVNDKGNGYFQRSLGSPVGKLSLRVPRDRDGDFRPDILPEKHVRDSPERMQLLETLVGSRYSPNEVSRVLKSLDMSYNPEQLTELKERYLKEFEQWKSRELPQDMIAIVIDAYHASGLCDGKVRKIAAYSVLGIDFDGYKDLLGVYVRPGGETREFWLQVFNDLVERGLKRPLMVISDDFSGLKSAVEALYPKSSHQLCLVHMQRNVQRNMGREDAREFKEEWEQIKVAKDIEQGRDRFEKLLQKFETKYPNYIAALRDDTDNYLAFLVLPKSVRKYFRTTNSAESFNSSLERMRRRMGGFFQSIDTLKVATFITYQGLRNKWSKGIPHVKGHLYEIRQLFAQRYGETPQ